MDDGKTRYDFVEPGLPEQRRDDAGRVRQFLRHLIEAVR